MAGKQAAEWTTWDGQPVSPTPPHGATIVVYRHTEEGAQYLVLHRAHAGSQYEGEWAWGPPAGARYPGEPLDACAARELEEETGLRLPSPLRRLTDPTGATEEWALYLLEAPASVQVRLSPEHDRFEWLSIEEAIGRCSPKVVAEQLRVGARERSAERVLE